MSKVGRRVQDYSLVTRPAEMLSTASRVSSSPDSRFGGCVIKSYIFWDASLNHRFGDTTWADGSFFAAGR